MLPRSQKVKKDRIEGILKIGKSVRTSCFLVKYVPSSASRSNLLVIVSKKVSNSAVIRNKIKRQVYSMSRPFLKKITKQQEIILFPQKNVMHLTTIELQNEVRTIFEKLS